MLCRGGLRQQNDTPASLPQQPFIGLLSGHSSGGGSQIPALKLVLALF